MKKSKSGDSGPSLVTLKNLGIRYGKKQIISGVSLDIRPGSFTGISGKSGSGKSSLLYCLGGFLKPSSGEYLFNGNPVYRTGGFGLGKFRKNHTGFLFQDFRLIPFLTVRQNIHFPLYFTGRKFSGRDVEMIMEKMGISHRADALPGDISGGEAQRTALARALLMNPELLLLDEPTGNLDGETEKEIVDILLDLKSKGLTLICVTHSPGMLKKTDSHFKVENGTLKIGT